MNVGILSASDLGFRPILAEGLARMLKTVGAVPYTCQNWNALLSDPLAESRRIIRSARRFKRKLQRHKMAASLRGCDLIVVVSDFPTAFTDSLKIEKLRNLAPSIPVILYTNYFPPTLHQWDHPKSNQPRRSYGLERYDWYFSSSLENVLEPPDKSPVTEIGLNLEDGSLFPNQNGNFTALLDFERPNEMIERATQICALDKAGIPFRVLNGTFSRSAIREIYRQTSVYFLAHGESFGVPVCELQACGSLIVSPSESWCIAHRLKQNKEISPTKNRFNKNFLIYNSDSDRLVRLLNEAKKLHSTDAVRDRFLRSHPHLFYGNIEALSGFLDRFKDEIKNGSHRP